jgi:excisionase family DNA binding protein
MFSDNARLLSIKQAASRLGMCTTMIYRFHNEGKLPFVKLARRTFVDPADLEKLIHASKIAA